MKFYNAKLKTGNKTDEQIKSTFDVEVSQKEIEFYRKAYDLIDGLEIIVANSLLVDTYMTLVAWDENDLDIWRDFVYYVEQDPYFGTYVNDRGGFVKDWESGEYEPSGSIYFAHDDLEILKQLNLEVAE